MPIQSWANSSSSMHHELVQWCLIVSLYSRFHEQAAALKVSADDLYNALLADAENESPNWNLQGRQAGVWKQLGEYTSFVTRTEDAHLLNFV